MRHGMAPKDACLDVLKRIARNFNDDEAKLMQFDINFYALRKDGEFGGASLWNGVWRQDQLRPRQFTYNDGSKSKLESCVYLLERKKP